MKTNFYLLENFFESFNALKEKLLTILPQQLLHPFLNKIFSKRIPLLISNKVIIIAFFSLFFTNKVLASFTVASGSSVNASTLTSQTGILTINGTLHVDANVSLLGFTSVIINGPNGQILWDNNYDLKFAAGTTFDINNPALGLQPTSGNASTRLYIGGLIAVSNDNSNNAPFSFADFNSAGGLPLFAISSSPLSPATICYGASFTATITNVDNGVSFDCDWSISATGGTTGASISPVSSTNWTTPQTVTFTPANLTTAKTYTITCVVNEHGDVGKDPITTKSVTVTVNPAPGFPTLVTATNATICAGSSSNLNATSTGNSINWYTASTAGTLLGNVASAANFPQSPATTTNYYAEAKIAGTGCVSLTRVPVIVTVNTPAAITSTTNNSVCVGTSSSIAVAATGTSVGYVWNYSVDGIAPYIAVPNAAPYSGVTSATLNVSATTLAMSSYYYKVVVSPTSSSVCTTSVSSTVALKFGNVWMGGTSNDWNNIVNWSDGTLPSNLSCATVYILNKTNQPTLNTTPAVVTITDLNIADGATLTVNNATIKIAGTINNNTSGTFNVTNGSLDFNGTGSAQNISGNLFLNGTLKNLTISNAVNIAASPSNALNIKGTLAFGNVNTTLTTGDNLVLVSDASGTARVADITNNGANLSNTITGKVTVQRYYPARRSWHLLTSPLSNTATIFNTWQNGGVYVAGKGMFVTGNTVTLSNGLDTSSHNNFSMKKWNLSTGVYSNVSDTKAATLSSAGTSAANVGYFTFVRGDRNRVVDNTIFGNDNTTTLSSTGNLQTGTQTFNIGTGNGSYALIGNPYASAVDFTKITKTNVLPSRFYVYDPSLGTLGGFVTMDDYNNTGTFTATPASAQRNFIQASQAFFVQVTGAGGTVTFNENSKSTDYTPQLFRPLTPASQVQSFNTTLVQLNADNSTLMVDGNTVQFNDEFNDAVDIQDAPKFPNITENLGILRYNRNLSVERRPLLKNNDTVVLNLTKTTQRKYRFEFAPANLSTAITPFLQDGFTGKTTLLNSTAVATYDFEINADAQSAKANRFKIVFKSAVSPLLFTYKSIKASQQVSDIAVEWVVENESNISRYEVERSLDGENFVTLNATIATGANTYNFTDANPVSGNNFYRIRSVSTDDKFQYSKLVVVKMDKTSGIRVYPNPITDGSVSVEFKNMATGKYSIRLLTGIGETIFTKTISHAAVTSTEKIHTANKLISGMYQLQITAPDKATTVIKVIVQ